MADDDGRTRYMTYLEMAAKFQDDDIRISDETRNVMMQHVVEKQYRINLNIISDSDRLLIENKSFYKNHHQICSQ